MGAVLGASDLGDRWTLFAELPPDGLAAGLPGVVSVYSAGFQNEDPESALGPEPATVVYSVIEWISGAGEMLEYPLDQPTSDQLWLEQLLVQLGQTPPGEFIMLPAPAAGNRSQAYAWSVMASEGAQSVLGYEASFWVGDHLAMVVVVGADANTVQAWGEWAASVMAERLGALPSEASPAFPLM